MITLAQARTLKRGDVLHHAKLRYHHSSAALGKKADPITCTVHNVRLWKDGNFRIEAKFTPEIAFFITSWEESYERHAEDWCLTPQECTT